MRTRKCDFCGVSDTPKEQLVKVKVTEKSEKCFHEGACYDNYLKDKEFKESEAKELDGLVETIKSIYGAKTIPNTVYPYLQDLRNGTRFFGKKDYKYKEGYTYDLIRETFEYCSETIEYWNARKDFNGLTNALRYGLVIVCDKLGVVEERRKRREKNAIAMDKHIQESVADDSQFNNAFKKKKDSIGDLFD